MAVQLSRGGRQATAHQRLEAAVASFQAALNDDQRKELQEMTRRDKVPDADAILVFTAGLDSISRQQRGGTSVSTRFHSFLSAVGDFCAVLTGGAGCNVVDTYVSSHPEIEALVWGSVKITMIVSSWLEAWHILSLLTISDDVRSS